ncbi:N-acetylglucosamine kinase [Alloacidobacterium sp.]|uniref:N-acetylglucosamine kinase n=1 Tax=Alloacidobacterium sp. TaxID=2951999 RepID=UPI002D63C57B|nr:BadF/BadG/BcrA/BcrD ATPase family protein [Alloacidobacterium sp.]HYK35971.1 BadF/BadG/BcrA/BcrD ATPase family protein [Alloacidobacterium sp.]
MALYLGFDAGGTKTDCALADENSILARAQNSSIKPLRVSTAQAEANMRALLEEITRQSGADLKQVAVSCVGTAGLRFPQTKEWMQQIISRHSGGEILVCGDEATALDAAFPGQAGVLVIGGTGSNILGRTSAGETFNVGGWGSALGDEGSGYWIGHEGLKNALRAHDFQQPTMIVEKVMRFWSAPTLGDLAEIGNQTPFPDFSLLAPIIVECAEAGDAVALEVLQLGGQMLGENAVHAVRRLRALEPDAPLPGIAYVGGILKSVGFVRESMIETIHRGLPMVKVLPEAVDPVIGALWRARNRVR